MEKKSMTLHTAPIAPITPTVPNPVNFFSGKDFIFEKGLRLKESVDRFEEVAIAQREKYANSVKKTLR